MLEVMLDWIMLHVWAAPYLIFLALMLAGLNIPISEDAVFVLSGVIASSLGADHVLKFFLWTFAGAYFSDWEAYFVGKFLGRKLFKWAWFKSAFSRVKPIKIRYFFMRYGFWTLLVGRFIPFGVRNCLFMTAGMARMPFLKFAVSDGIACFISSTVLFSLGYTLGKNQALLESCVWLFNLSSIVIVLSIVLITALVIWLRKGQKAIN